MIQALTSMYSWRYPYRLLALFSRCGRQYWSYVTAYWRVSNFEALPLHMTDFSARERFFAHVVLVGMAAQVLIGVLLIGIDVFRDTPGSWQFGLALAISYPLVWAHVLPVTQVVWWLAHPKALGRRILCALLEAQVRRLRKRHSFKLVAVAGSVGKTSTKMAIANVLSASRRVRWQEGNYNDRVTVPLIFFGHHEPAIFNVIAWVRILLANERSIRKPYPYDVVVAELGTDGPGFMKEFAYCKPDVAVVTAITPEHMEYFGTLDAVASEELTILDYSQSALVNIDDTPSGYLAGRTFMGYGLNSPATYSISERRDAGLDGQHIKLQLGTDTLDVTIPLLGQHGAKIALAAAATAHMLQVPLDAIGGGMQRITAFAGRMRLFAGIHNSVIIDDTYNASPVAVKAALDVVYALHTSQRIAILGSMNELGDYSPQAHREVGEYCDPRLLTMVVTIGPDANEHLAPAAEAKGCVVHRFVSPYDAGAFVREHLQEGAVVLAKGSQNRVFAEEALKALFANPADEAQLVRQSAYWLDVKRRQFKPQPAKLR